MFNKMPEVKEVLNEELANLVPFLEIDNGADICSGVFVSGSFDKKEDWKYQIFHNSRYFQFSISPKNKERDYTGGDLTLEMLTCGLNPKKKFRKTSGDKNKITQKLKEWILANL